MPVSKEKPLRLTIEFGPAPQKRSLSQNDIFHKWCHVMADSTGHTPDEIKETLKDMFIPKKVVQVAGKSRLVSPGTSALEKAEMSLFLDKVEAFAVVDLGIVLPRNL